MPSELYWRRVLEAADRRAKKFKEIIISAVRDIKSGMVRAEIARVVEAGAEEVISKVPFDRLETAQKEIQGMYQVLMEAGASLAVERAKEMARVDLSFDIFNPQAIDFIRERGANLVVEIDNSIRESIRSIISRGVTRGYSVDNMAKEIIRNIGLTKRQSLAVLNYKERLIAEKVRNVEAKVEAYSKRLLEYRAENISRTETLTAVNEGQRQAWLQGKERLRGYLREWIATEDERVCEDCLAMSGEKAPLDGVYSNGTSGPPLHPQCRCTEILVRED